MTKLAINEDKLVKDEPALFLCPPLNSPFSWERRRGVTVVEVQRCPRRTTANICASTAELRNMKPGKNPNGQLENLRPAAVHRCGGGALFSSS